MLLGWWNERLDDVHVSLSTIRQQLSLKAVVAEPFYVDLRAWHAQPLTDVIRQRLMCTA